MGMQNWEHVADVVGRRGPLNRTPVRDHGADFSRVREWNLCEQARFYRQVRARPPYGAVIDAHKPAPLSPPTRPHVRPPACPTARPPAGSLSWCTSRHWASRGGRL